MSSSSTQFDPMNRRAFLKGTGLAGLGVGAYAMLSPAAAVNDQILVYIFLRGGIDGANVLTPLGVNDGRDYDYYALMRPTLRLPDSGPGAPLPIDNGDFGFNPVAAPLLDLYNDGYLAVVHATGTPNHIASRSHFDAEKYIELGTPGLVNTTSGWLHRHFDASANQLYVYPNEMLIPILAFRSTTPSSLLGNHYALTVYQPSSFRLDNAHWRWSASDPGAADGIYRQLDMLPELYGGDSDFIEKAGAQALVAEAIMRINYDSAYTGSGAIAYPDAWFGQRMRDLAQLIKLDPETNLRIATLDYNGWDTHASQNDTFDSQLGDLSQALAAFFDDLNSSAGNYADRVTVILQSEFGRRWYQNNDDGTDHGNGNLMLVLGKQVNGGQYGNWPGAYPGSDWVNYPNPSNGSWAPELYEGAVSVTTDFRRVLSEFLLKRAQHTASTLNAIFPAYSYEGDMGIFTALAEPPNTIMVSDFE